MSFHRYISFFLFARPSFIEGVSRTLDLGGVFDAYNESPTPTVADTRATYRDWLAVGQDINSAISIYELSGETDSQ